MNLRPIETMGTQPAIAWVHQHLGLGAVPCMVLQDRQPWPPNKGKVRMPSISEPFVLLADPLAVYVFAKVNSPDAPQGALGVMIFAPHAETIEDGFIVQRFLVWINGRGVMASPQEPARHTSGAELEKGIMTVRSDGPSGVSDGLAVDVPHALSGLIVAQRLAGKV